MKFALLSFLFALSYSENDCEMIYGSTFNTTLYRSSITNYCFTIVNSLFLGCMSESSGGAISIHCRPSYGIVHECAFIRCQTKAQAACIYFSGSMLESFRCCCINCSARYNAMFSSSQHTVQSEIDKKTTIDMLTVYSSTAQTNAISTQNGDTKITNINLTKSRSTGTILSIELTDIPHGEISYFTFYDNKGDNRDSSIIYVLDDVSETSKNIHHGNFIKNTCANGGYLFNFIALGTISDCIFKDNARATLFAIRYCVTFISCVFDGAESHTDFQTFKSCQFLTETSTMEFTMMDCEDSIYNQKLNTYLADTKNIIFVRFNTFGYAAILLGIVALFSIIVYVVVRIKRNEENENEKESLLSTTPLVK